MSVTTYTENELDKLKIRIGINKDYEEWFISDYEDCFFDLGEYEDIELLNELMQACCELNNEALIKAAFDHETVNSASYALEVLENINDNYCLLEHLKDNVEYGMYLVDNYYMDEFKQLGHLSKYIDYEAIGHDCELNGQILHTEYGCLEIIK